MNTSKELFIIQNRFFGYIIFTSYLLYFIALFGLSASAPNYLNKLQYWVKIYVSLFLIWRFNWLRKIKFNELDKKIAFTAGLFLLTTTFIDQIINSYLQKIKKNITEFI